MIGTPTSSEAEVVGELAADAGVEGQKIAVQSGR